MKHLTTAVLISSLAISGVGISATVLADEYGMHERHGHGYDGKCWRTTLSDEQSKQVDQLKLNYKKKASPLKAKIKQAKVDLALLISADKPSQKDIDKKIDEMTKLKAEKMRLKAAYQVDVRKVLTPEQRVNFDMKLLKKANRDRKAYGHGYGHY